MNELKVDPLLEIISEHTLVRQNTNAERRTRAVVCTMKGADMDALDYIQGSQEVTDRTESVEDKPWRRPGADISDYFNFGFDEQTWIAYHNKYTKLCAANRKLYTKTKRRHTTRRESEPASSSSSGLLASRVSTIDQNGKQPGPRVECHSCLTNKGNNTQVATEMLPQEGRVIYHLNPEFTSVCAYTTPLPLLYQPGGPATSPMATLDRGHAKEFDGPSSSQDPCSSGVSSLITGSLIYSAGVMNTTKAWEYVARCDQDRDRSRDQRHGRDSKRENSGEEQTRHRDTTERGHKRKSFKRVRKEEQGERTQKKRGCSGGSSRRSGRENGEDRESQSRRKCKKAKRNKEKETDKKSSADPERKLKSD